MMFEENFFYTQDEVKTFLNFNLAIRNECTSKEMWNILILHEYRKQLFEEFAKIWEQDQFQLHSYKRTQKLVQELEDLEYDLQFFWHFPLNHNFHSWWQLVVGCKCYSHIPGETRVVSKVCKLHNSELYEV